MRNGGRMVILAIAVLAFLATMEAGVRETEGASMAPVPRHGGQIFNNHEYLLVTKSETWQDAKKACNAAGGHLVTITSVSENTFVNGLQGSDWVWMGFTDEAKEGDWRWITGERVTYTNWHSGQPDNKGAGQDYGMLWDDGTWDDDGGPKRPDEREYYVCEWG